MGLGFEGLSAMSPGMTSSCCCMQSRYTHCPTCSICAIQIRRKTGGGPKMGYLLGGPHNEDYKVLGSILGTPYLRKLPIPLKNINPFSMSSSMLFSMRFSIIV